MSCSQHKITNYCWLCHHYETIMPTGVMGSEGYGKCKRWYWGKMWKKHGKHDEVYGHECCEYFKEKTYKKHYLRTLWKKALKFLGKATHGFTE